MRPARSRLPCSVFPTAGACASRSRSPIRTGRASLVTYGSFARRLRTADYPWGWSAEHLAEVLRGMDQGWASGKWWSAANPSVADDEHYQAWWARYLRAAASPSMGRGALGLNAELDIRHLLTQVAVPTLVIHRTNEQWVDVGNS